MDGLVATAFLFLRGHHMTLLEYFEDVYSLERELGIYTTYQYRNAIRRFEQWCGLPVQLNELSEPLLSRWIRHEQELGQLGARSIKNKRADILTVWRHASRKGLATRPSEDVRSVKVDKPVPRAWDMEELKKLLAVAEKAPGYFGNGLPRREYLWALLKTAYETGLRRDDLFRLDVARDIDAQGRISTIQGKTRQGHTPAIRVDTREALLRLRDRLKLDGYRYADTPLRWMHEPRDMYHWLKKLCGQAGIDYGALQHLRRTGATHCEREQPGSAMSYLGHKTPGLAYAHYVDARLSRPPRMPPDPAA